MIAPNHPRPKRTEAKERAQEQLRRLLLLIDLLAPMRGFNSVITINAMTADRVGIAVCRRTTLRDLKLLDALGFVETMQRPAVGCRHETLYRLNIRTTVGIQTAAMALADGYVEAA